MNAVDTFRMFADGAMSVHDIYALMISMGHSREDCVNAFNTVTSEPGTTIRFSKAVRDEYQAEIFVKA